MGKGCKSRQEFVGNESSNEWMMCVARASHADGTHGVRDVCIKPTASFLSLSVLVHGVIFSFFKGKPTSNRAFRVCRRGMDELHAGDGGVEEGLVSFRLPGVDARGARASFFVIAEAT